MDTSYLLDQKHYTFSLRSRELIGDIQDFIDLSERTIEWQYHVELQSIRRRPPISGEGITPHDAQIYMDQCLEDADFRFKISLPRRVRYAALVSLITAVEWSSAMLKIQASFKIRGCDPTKIIKAFCDRLSLERESVLTNYGHLKTIRDTVVHGAGIIRSKTRDGARDLVSAIDALPGFEIIEWPLLGDSIGINRGALEPHIANMAALLPELYEAADNNHLLK